MQELIIFNYLKEHLGVTVSFENCNEDEYVLIGKSGSNEDDYITSATFFIQSYSTSRYKASMLNEKVKELMDDLVKLDEISFSRLNNDYDYTDTSLKKYRYQAVYDVGFF